MNCTSPQADWVSTLSTAIVQRRLTVFRSLGVIVLSACVSGCDILLDEALDCLDGDRPRLSPNVVENPVLNQEYRQVIQASIDNEPRDDRFGYDFSINGSLPQGLSSEEIGREFIIGGTPLELGEFSFELTVVVDDPSANGPSGSGLCSTIERTHYSFDVQMM